MILGSVKNFFKELDDLSSVSVCCEISNNVASLGQNCIFFILFGFKEIREIGYILSSIKHLYCIKFLVRFQGKRNVEFYIMWCLNLF